MEKVTRLQFVGSWFYFWLLCITGIGIPIAFLYLINGTVVLESQVADSELFVQEYRAGKLSR